jgi:hypothetical protein
MADHTSDRSHIIEGWYSPRFGSRVPANSLTDNAMNEPTRSGSPFPPAMHNYMSARSPTTAVTCPSSARWAVPSPDSTSSKTLSYAFLLAPI